MINQIESNYLAFSFVLIAVFFLALILLIRKLFINIKLRKKTEKSQLVLLQEYSFQKKALDEHAIVSITDKQGIIIYVNELFCKISGYSQKELIGKNHRILKSNNQPESLFRDIWETISNGNVWHGNIQNKAKNGLCYWVHSTIVPMLDENGTPEKYIAIRTDISESKLQEEMLEKLAHFDILTGLPNRRLFINRFNQAISYAKRTNTMLALCFIDLDNFKPVNDMYGHDIGDKLLVEVSARIKQTIRNEDTVSRQGGDEFALLLGNLNTPFHSEKILERLNLLIAKPYIIDSHTINISASIGVVLYPLDDEDLDIMMRYADQAMYDAKLAGRNGYQFFNAEQNKKVIEKQSKLSEIKRAIKNNEFKLYYQPKINMKTGKIFGVEALIRWIHPVEGLIPPLDFLPFIDSTDLELTIGGWVMNEAITQLDTWHQQGVKIEVSINVSSYHLQSERFFSQLKSAFEKYPDVAPHYLQLEVLESSALSDINAISDNIKKCQDILGITVALDDFGTGYSSLTHLRNLSADVIKIDQSFVLNMLEDRDDLVLIKGIISLAKAFKCKVIAEGVETAEHGVLLMRIGCDSAQGYGIAKPMPADEIPHWIVQYSPDEAWSIWSSSEWEMSNFPLVTAQSDHIKWVQEIFNVLEGNEFALHHDELTDLHKCRLGTWYYTHGKKHYSHLPAFYELESIHTDVHKVGHQILELHFEGKKEEAIALSMTLLKLKSEVLDKLNMLQKQVNFIVKVK